MVFLIKALAFSSTNFPFREPKSHGEKECRRQDLLPKKCEKAREK